MSNLELEIGRRFRRRVLRVHPLVLRILTAVVSGVESKWAFAQKRMRTQMNARFPLIDERLSYSSKLIRSELRADKSRAECRYVKNDHDEREEIHSHRKANPDVHCTNAD